MIRFILKWLFPPNKPILCKICNDTGYHECNIWFDEIIIVDCQYCKKKINNK